MTSPDERRCYIHAGTHRTGTTSIQVAMTTNAAALAADGVLVPRAGRPIAAGIETTGHHNLAWEINADRRFLPEYGTLEDLGTELRSTTLPRAIISSEDFILTHEKPAGLAALRNAIVTAGFEPVVIIYVREQAAYAQSQYAELSYHGLTTSFAEYTDEILRDGSFAFGGYRLLFEYHRLVEPFRVCFGSENLVVRPYRSQRTALELLSDLFSGQNTDWPISAASLLEVPRLNPSRSYRDVMTAIYDTLAAGRAGLPRPDSIAERAALSPGALEETFRPMGPADVERFHTRFAASNAILQERYGVEPQEAHARSSPLLSEQQTFLDACAQAWR